MMWFFVAHWGSHHDEISARRFLSHWKSLGWEIPWPLTPRKIQVGCGPGPWPALRAPVGELGPASPNRHGDFCSGAGVTWYSGTQNLGPVCFVFSIESLEIFPGVILSKYFLSSPFSAQGHVYQELNVPEALFFFFNTLASFLFLLPLHSFSFYL